MEDIIFDEYDEYEAENTSAMKAVKNHHYSSAFRKCALALALAVAVSTGFSAVPGKFNNMATVEAARKKDKKKPVIKLSGKSNIRVTQNESVKIPKATAKDNVDGNVTKKIKVSVKSGKKSYASIAKKIQKNKAVKFTKTGKYTIAYTVSDKAKNKATKKRTVTVVAKQEDKKTTENKTTTEKTKDYSKYDIKTIYEDENINEYDLTLFIKDENGKYDKYEENHIQRAYCLDRIKELISEAGLEYVTSYDAFTKNAVRKDSDRIYVIAREKGKKVS